MNLLSARIDGEIDRESLIVLDAHVAGCDSCRVMADEFERQDSELRQAFAPRRVAAAAVATRVVCALEPAPLRIARYRWWGVPTAMAAGFLLAVVMLRPWKAPVVASNPPPTAPPVTSRLHTASDLAQRINGALVCGARLEAAQRWEEDIRRCGGECASVLAQHVLTCRASDRAERVWAARILADVAPTSSIPDLIALVGDEDGDVCRYAAEALARLTGRPHCAEPDEWHNDATSSCGTCEQTWHSWWQENKQKFASKS
jgi:anti-sigma factor RsiW